MARIIPKRCWPWPFIFCHERTAREEGRWLETISFLPSIKQERDVITSLLLVFEYVFSIISVWNTRFLFGLLNERKQGHVRSMNVDEIFFYLWIKFLFIFFVWLDEEKIRKNLSFFILLVDALCQINRFKERRKKQIHPPDIFRNEKFQNFRR